MNRTRTEQARLLKLLEEKKITEKDFQMLSKSLRSKPLQWRWVFFPFMKLNGLPAIIASVFLTIAISFLAWHGNLYFPGLLDLKQGMQSSFLNLLGQNLIIWLLSSLIFFAAAKIGGQKSLNLADFFSSFGFARISYLFGAAVLPLLPQLDQTVPPAQLLSTNPIAIVGITVVALLSIIWLVTAYFQAYKLASGLHKAKLITTFVIALIIGEILTIVVIRSFLI